MKRLFVMRHAKSSWADPRLADIDRPLNERGRAAAPYMGSLMRRLDLVPQFILASPAKRAKKTAQLAKEGGAFDAEIQLEDAIYEASPNALRQVLAENGNGFSSVLLVGHNPGMEGLVRYLTGETQPMPTAAIAVIDLDIDRWDDLDEGSGSIKTIYRPRDEMSAEASHPFRDLTAL